MVTTNAIMWFVRAGRKGAYIDFFRDHRVVAVGWAEAGPIGLTESDDYLRRHFEAVFPGDRAGWHQAKRFVREVQIGDHVITYDVGRRLYHVGTIRSDVEIQSRPVIEYAERYPYDRWEYVRRVSWQSTVSRHVLSVAARNCLNAQLTLTLVATEVSEEIRRLCA